MGTTVELQPVIQVSGDVTKPWEQPIESALSVVDLRRRLGLCMATCLLGLSMLSCAEKGDLNSSPQPTAMERRRAALTPKPPPGPTPSTSSTRAPAPVRRVKRPGGTTKVATTAVAVAEAEARDHLQKLKEYRTASVALPRLALAADAVVVAKTMLATPFSGVGTDAPGVRMKVQVLERWRGSVPAVFEVTWTRTSAEVPLQLHTTYLLFIKRLHGEYRRVPEVHFQTVTVDSGKVRLPDGDLATTQAKTLVAGAGGAR